MSESGESESSFDGGFRMKEVLLAAGFNILEVEGVEKRRVLEVMAGVTALAMGIESSAGRAAMVD